MAPFEALYGRRCRSPIGWFEVGEAKFLGLDLVYHGIEKVKLIQERLRTAQSSQKSYTDMRSRDLEFQVDDLVFLKVSPKKVKDGITFKEIPVTIHDRQVCKLRAKEVVSVKVLWRSQEVEEATWEVKKT
ncbi:uncharacterized protein LOC132639336 [Lycium barbarum]|uniref:uncharacterized protein LOC132639336 n=1 Tax=Lycium barbarum TaxID=112863 RepID=UPI00293E9F12|nr:uncharacterized protein LOC132639336 [Lycium barbarum]